MIDEGPSDEDLDRFGDGAAAYCPECGAEIFDDLEQCPACGMYITGSVARSPAERAARKKRMRIIAVVTLIGFLLLAGVGGLLRVF